MTTFTPAFAVIDGKLCRLTRNGSVNATHLPLATGVIEFRPGALRLYVRENPYGLLPGVPNLYCVDPNFRMIWLAEWPLPDDPCGRIVDEADDVLRLESVSGVAVRLESSTGRALPSSAMAAAV